MNIRIRCAVRCTHALLAALVLHSRQAQSDAAPSRTIGAQLAPLQPALASVSANGRATQVWSNPESVLVVRNWAGSGPAQVADGAATVALGPDDLVLVPIERGDWIGAVAVPTSVTLQFGFADGTSNIPDTIVWQSLGESRIHVPAWNNAPYAAIRARSTARLKVTMSAPEVDPLDWFYLDSAVSNWARSDAPLPDQSRSDVRRVLAAVTELRDSITESQRKQAAPLLIGLWLEESARIRPLSRPFFQPMLESPETSPRVFIAPTRIRYHRSAADLHRWQIQAKGSARVIIREGDGIARVMQWQSSGTNTEKWTTPQSVRTVALDPSSQPEVEVVSGVVSVSLQGFNFQPELRESLGFIRRMRFQLWSEASLNRESQWRTLFRRPGDTHHSRAQEQFASSSFEHLRLSQTSRTLESAIASAWTGMRLSRSTAWQELLSSRLLDLNSDAKSTDDAAMIHPMPKAVERPPTHSADAAEPLTGTILQEASLPPRLGRRPTWGQAVETWTMARHEDSLVGRVAAHYWRAFPYRTVTPVAGTETSARLVPLGGSGLCNPARENVEAWFVPGEDTTEVNVDVEPGVYAVATLRPIGDSPSTEGEVYVDGVPVTIHAGAGLSSRVALSRGKHVVSRGATTPDFAIEATYGMQLPCSGLFRWQRWSKLRASTAADFPLPSPGASSVVRLRFDGVATTTRLGVLLGSRRFEVVTRAPASGTAELPIDASDDTLSLSSAAPISVLLSMRRELDPVALPQSMPRTPRRVSGGPAPPQPVLALPSGMLAELVELGRMLRSNPETAAALVLRRRRAQLLAHLGFASLATRDGDFEASIEPRSDLIRVEDSADKVIPMGILSTIGPLRLPEDQTGLVARRQAWRDSAGADCAGGLHQARRAGASAETLLEAFCAERVGLSAAAAELYAQIALTRRQGPVLVHAASLLADAAEAARDRQLGLCSAIWAARAMAWGEGASGLRARLTKAVHWVTPSVLNGAAGVTAIAHGQAEAQTDRQRVLASLVDAQPHALLVEHGQAADLLLNNRQPESISVRFGCDVPVHVDACKLVAWLDGATTHCELDNSGNGCMVTAPAGKHRVRFAFDADGGIGWITTELGKRLLAPTITTEWSVLDAGTVATVAIRGPTVLQLRARGTGQSGESISLEGCNIEPEYATLALPTGLDPHARYWPTEEANAKIGLSVEKWIPIDTATKCEVRIGARQSNTKLHLAFARADGLPAARLATQMPSTPASEIQVRSIQGRTADSNPPLPRKVDERQPVLLGARTRFVSESLSVALEQDTASSEGAFQDVYGETSAFVARELVAHRWWGTLQAGARFRSGPTTEFARVSFDLPPRGSLPGVDLTSSVYTQSFGATRSTTLSTTGKLARRWEISQNVAVIPQASFTTLRVGREPASQAGVDGDVYSNFYATHPRYASLAAMVATRPYVDTLVNLSLSSRSLPRLDGFDRVSATAELIILPVPSWPLLAGLDWMSSYRPASSLRAEMFVRHDFGLAWGLWHWVTPNERVRWFGRVDFFFDAPAAKLGSVIVAPTVGIELVSGGARGLRDLSPQQVPMREFQERGSARVRVGRAGTLDDAPTLGAIP